MEGTVSLVLFGSFAAMLLVGAPITVALSLAALAAFLFVGENPIQFVQIAFTSVGSFPLMALPAFILAGALMEATGISRRLIAFAESIAGPFTGGLGAATIIACVFFGAISGSGPATTAAVGMLMIPAMARRGYDKGYGASLTAASGGLGIVIPPSIPMVIFGISAIGLQAPPEAVERFGSFASVSIAKLFIAGMFPGLMLATSLLVMNAILSHRRGFVGNGEAWSFTKVVTAGRHGFWALLAPVVILGGIYSGWFTPTEAAVVAIFYTLFVGLFIYRSLRWEALFRSLETTTWITGRVLLILFAATVFGRVLVTYEVPTLIADSMLALTTNIYLIWLFFIVFLLAVGMFMETLAAIMILVQVMLPVAYSVGIDPTHFGIVMICCLAVGFQTPPLGENLFIAAGIANRPVEEIAVKALPFVAVNTLAILLIAFFPQISLFLPTLLGY